jgi:sterol desaturase/sphingolipid hydroxylase (fatty acid hydroxylase superfamily)
MNEKNKIIQSNNWLVRKSTIKILWILMIIILVFTVLAQIPISIHGHFGIDELLGFNALYGFLSCLAMVFIAKILGFFIKRKDTYYND